jgi:hypothetical protein
MSRFGSFVRIMAAHVAAVRSSPHPSLLMLLDFLRDRGDDKEMSCGRVGASAMHGGLHPEAPGGRAFYTTASSLLHHYALGRCCASIRPLAGRTSHLPSCAMAGQRGQKWRDDKMQELQKSYSLYLSPTASPRRCGLPCAVACML